MKVRKKPVVVDAAQWNGGDQDAYRALVEELGTVQQAVMYVGQHTLLCNTSEGAMRAGVGDWIIKGVMQEVYPCRDDVFQQTYEPA